MTHSRSLIERRTPASTYTTFLAVRDLNGATSTPDRTLVRHFDVSCAKCRETYGVWGPATEMGDELRHECESWLAEHLPNVCPYHKDSFPVPVGDLE
jgi:hypothetical protein